MSLSFDTILGSVKTWLTEHKFEHVVIQEPIGFPNLTMIHRDEKVAIQVVPVLNSKSIKEEIINAFGYIEKSKFSCDKRWMIFVGSNTEIDEKTEDLIYRYLDTYGSNDFELTFGYIDNIGKLIA
ncbi:MAG: hypothetical protein H7A25_03360 [Leptospiraceae bacterium]|nr:hypothetical protein [Leptospiraceae bacterium]MCP5498914.1 hypothetical protein [Leptospiraceae bacterium]